VRGLETLYRGTSRAIADVRSVARLGWLMD